MLRRATIAVATGAAAAAVLASGGVAAAAVTSPSVTASSSVRYSVEQGAYAATGARFRFVSTTVYLRPAGQFAPELGSSGGLGYSVQLWSAKYVLVLGVSDTATSGTTYSPDVAVFDTSTHAQLPVGVVNAYWCPAGGTCQPAADGGSFQPGQSVTESIYYNARTGVDHFSAYDSAGDLYTAWMRDQGEMFKQARVGNEFGCTPWSGPCAGGAVSYQAPDMRVKVGVFRDITLTDYAGHHAGFVSFWRHGKVIMTATGTAGAREVGPGELTDHGHTFTVFMYP